MVFGVEEQLFRGDRVDDQRAEFCVAISRAKHELTLTWAQSRPPPAAVSRWDAWRQAKQEFLDYAVEE